MVHSKEWFFGLTFMILLLAFIPFPACSSMAVTDPKSSVPENVDKSLTNETIPGDSPVEFDSEDLYTWLFNGGNRTGFEDILVVYYWGGGWAGMESDDMIIFTNGTILWSVNDRSGTYRKGSINQSEMNTLHKLLSNTSFSSYNMSYETPYPPYTEGYSGFLVYQGKLIRYDFWVDMPPELEDLIVFVAKLFENLS